MGKTNFTEDFKRDQSFSSPSELMATSPFRRSLI